MEGLPACFEWMSPRSTSFNRGLLKAGSLSRRSSSPKSLLQKRRPRIRRPLPIFCGERKTGRSRDLAASRPSPVFLNQGDYPGCDMTFSKQKKAWSADPKWKTHTFACYDNEWDSFKEIAKLVGARSTNAWIRESLKQCLTYDRLNLEERDADSVQPSEERSDQGVREWS